MLFQTVVFLHLESSFSLFAGLHKPSKLALKDPKMFKDGVQDVLLQSLALLLAVS